MECSEVLFLFTERIWQCFTIQLFQWLVPVTLIKNIIVINISSQILVADNEDSNKTNEYLQIPDKLNSSSKILPNSRFYKKNKLTKLRWSHETVKCLFKKLHRNRNLR